MPDVTIRPLLCDWPRVNGVQLVLRTNTSWQAIIYAPNLTVLQHILKTASILIKATSSHPHEFSTVLHIRHIC